MQVLFKCVIGWSFHSKYSGCFIVMVKALDVNFKRHWSHTRVEVKSV